MQISAAHGSAQTIVERLLDCVDQHTHRLLKNATSYRTLQQTNPTHTCRLLMAAYSVPIPSSGVCSPGNRRKAVRYAAMA